jgi:hypothetical protein
MPCEKSFVAVDPADMKDVRAGGSSGLADTGDGDGLAQVAIGVTRWFPGGTAYLGYRAPPEISKAVAGSFLALQVSTKALLALSATQYNGPRRRRSWFCEKGTAHGGRFRSSTASLGRRGDLGLHHIR